MALRKSGNRRILMVAGTLVATTAVAGTTLYEAWDRAVPLEGMAVNDLRSWSAPPRTAATERAEVATGPLTVKAVPAVLRLNDDHDTGNWSSYNKTLTPERYSELSRIKTAHVAGLKVLCTYDTRQYTSFETGLIMVNGALIGTTKHDTFSLDPATCHENWRTSENYQPASLLAVKRGATYLDGLLFRGTDDGRVLAYNVTSGKRVREFYLVPRADDDPVRVPQGAAALDRWTWGHASSTPGTGGASRRFCDLDPNSGAAYVPGGNAAPGFASGRRERASLHSGPVLVPDARTGAHRTHFTLVPQDWRDGDVTTAPTPIHAQGGSALQSVARKDGSLYGLDMAAHNRYHTDGTPDSFGQWAGRVYATDADTGIRKWRLKSNDPILSGISATAGDVVFFGDLGGRLCALDATGGVQKVAVATGFTSLLWSTHVVTAKVLILGLGARPTGT
jgi:alcohol dehydrogenase (cytochrome c)